MTREAETKREFAGARPRPAEDDGMSRTLGGAATDAEAVVEIGRFHVESKLGEGGMGVVLLANDPLLGRHVALKVLRRGDDGEGTEGARRRLLREAQGVAKLVHENVIVVHDVGTHDGQVYLAMEYVAGGTLRSWQAKRTWREVLATYVRAGRGLAAAHAAGLVHRDFKPDNVLVGDDGRVRVTDFGLVAAIGEAPPGATAAPSGELAVAMTRTGTIMGTPRYMAPEQHAATGVDARADQFAFCAALYEALYDAPPFPDADYVALRARVLAGDVAPVPADSDVPVAVRDAVLRGLRVDREERFGSMAELLAVLVKAEATVVVAPKRRAIWLAAPVVVGAIAWGGWWVLHEPAHEPARPIAAIPAGTSTGSARPWAIGVSADEQAKALDAFNTGNAALRDGRRDDAIARYLEALAHWDHPAIHYNLGFALVDENRYAEARPHLAAALVYPEALDDATKVGNARRELETIDGLTK